MGRAEEPLEIPRDITTKKYSVLLKKAARALIDFLDYQKDKLARKWKSTA